MRALVWREPHSALLFCNSTPSGCPQVLSSKTLGVMRSRVTPAGTVDAVLKVPLEFGQGCVCAARVRCAFPHNMGRAGLWSVATCHGKRARAAAASATPAPAAAFHLGTRRMRYGLCGCFWRSHGHHAAHSNRLQLFGHDALVFKSRAVRALSVQFTPHQLAFAFVANKMQPGLLGDYRSVELIESAYACLARLNFSNASVSKL